MKDEVTGRKTLTAKRENLLIATKTHKTRNLLKCGLFSFNFI